MNAVHQYVLMMYAAHRAHFISTVLNIISLYTLHLLTAACHMLSSFKPASFVGETRFCRVHGSALQM
jgi:hypothetical protein